MAAAIGLGEAPAPMVQGGHMFPESAGFEDEASLNPWPSAWGGLEAPSALPLWDQVAEHQLHREVMLGFGTKPCFELESCGRRGFWRQGKNWCKNYHNEWQRRRSPIDVTGQIQYWDVMCPAVSESLFCPRGDACPFAHNDEEMSYHPAKYKTRLCLGVDCREEACCYAHGEMDLRMWAPTRYSYWFHLVFKQQAASQALLGVPNMASFNMPGATCVPASSFAEDWRRPQFGRTQQLVRPKSRFCASYLPDQDRSECHRGAACQYAHTREEARTPLLPKEQEQQAPEALTEAFFMYQFKTLWCPVGVPHDWQSCVYAHNYQDARRKVSIGYGPKPCPYWSKKREPNAAYAQRCPLGLRCPYSHGAKEQLYHPLYFRTVTCRDVKQKAGSCPRQNLCAFFHTRRDQRKNNKADSTDYTVPLPEESLPQAWVNEFLIPPFRDSAGDGKGNCAEEEYADQQVNSEVQGMVNQQEVEAFWAAAMMQQEIARYSMAAALQCEAQAGLFAEFPAGLNLPSEVDVIDKEITPRTRSTSTGSAMALAEPSHRAPGSVATVGRDRTLGLAGTPLKVGPAPRRTSEEDVAKASYSHFQGYSFPGFMALAGEIGGGPSGKPSPKMVS